MAEPSRRTSRRIAATKSEGRRPVPIGVWLIGGFSLIAILLLVFFAVLNQRPAAEATDYSGIPAEWVDRNALGNPDAPVTIQAWEDFLCPACGQWTQTVKTRLMDEIEAGDLRLEYHYFPLGQHEPGASVSAQAAECAADQAAFWPMHDRLFQAQGQGASAFSPERMIEYAEELGLDESQFTSCLLNQTYLDEVQQSAADAVALGLNSTPSILLNGERVDNPMDYAALEAAIAEQSGASGD